MIRKVLRSIMIRKVLVFLFVLLASIGTTVNFWRPSSVWHRYRRGYAEFERRLRVRRMKATARKKIERLGRGKSIIEGILSEDALRQRDDAPDRKPRKPSKPPETEET